MPITGDLINLNTLVLTDTFNTWLNRTNQIVDSINPLQVYDVDVGSGITSIQTGGGLAKFTGEVAGNYNGVVTVGLNPGPGVGFETLGGQSRSVVDFALFDMYSRVLTGEGTSGDARRVAASDEFIINDVSDITKPAGVAKKVKARNMLPPEIAMDVLTISGDLRVLGNLSSFGANSFIASNDLQIEDKQIELAYQQAISLGMTGVTSGTFPLGGGPTAYYFVNGTTTVHSFYGNAQSFTAAAAGPTGTLVIGSLFGSLNDLNNSYGPEDFGATGFISLSSTGSTRYLYNTKGAIFNSFLNDSNLDEAGIVVKGSQGDKTWLWIYSDNDTGTIYNSWQANTNIGVESSTNAVISRVYRSYGYTGTDQTKSQFIFAAESNADAQIYLAQTTNEIVPLTFTGGSWRIERSRSNNYLTFSVGATGISSMSENFLITPGASGQTFAGVPVNNYAKNLNADLLDGAHASLTAAPFTIPIADSTGRISPDFASGDSVRRRYTQNNHGLTFGMAVRAIVGGNVFNGFTAAVATNAEFGEAIGIVSAVHSANEFTVTHQGRIENINATMRLEGGFFETGKVYFLGASASNRGKLTGDPDYDAATRLVTGQIRKPMLLALSATQGYVLDYVGSLVPSSAATDMVYLKGLIPVGTIHPYSGNVQNIPSEWLLCDGNRYRAVDYIELFETLQRNYFAVITVAVGSPTVTVVGGTRNILPGDNYDIALSQALTITRTVQSVNAAAGQITFTTSVSDSLSGSYQMKPRTDASGNNIFFVPDLRTRTIVGGSTGDGYNTVGLNPYVLSQQGGSELLTLGASNLPEHTHTTSTTPINYASGGNSTTVVTAVSVNGTIIGSGQPFSARTPYMVMHYIVRARAETPATVLTGHNHDGRYHLLNDNMKISSKGNFNSLPSANGTTGFNVYADSSLLGRTAYILSCFAPNNPFTGIGVPGYDSKTKTHVMGDLTVWGNGLTAFNGMTGSNRPTFSFSTHRSMFVIEGATANMPAPGIVFYTDGATVAGYITGLAAPVDNTQAVNKYYSDTSNKIVAQDTVGSGVGGRWSVEHEPVTLPAGANAPAYRGNDIVRVSWNQNSTPVNDSKLQTEVFGDFTVWGDGLPGNPNVTGHNTITFTVDPLKSEVAIEGRTDDPAKPAPTLSFKNSQTNSIFPAIGKINGLTAPTSGDQAANKDYVDSRQQAIYWIVNTPDDGDDNIVSSRNTSIPSFLVKSPSNGGLYSTSLIVTPNGSIKKLVWDSSTPPVGGQGNSKYYIKNVINNSFTETGQTGNLFTDQIIPGIYSISVMCSGEVPEGKKVLIDIQGFAGTTQLSRCRSFYDTQTNANHQLMTFNGFVKFGTSPKLVISYQVDGTIDDNDYKAIISTIMLTRTGSL